MAATVTPMEGALRLRQLSFALEAAALREATYAVREGRRYAVTQRMYPRAPASTPARPDKLTIRSGRLERSVKIVAPRRVGDSIIAGLEAGGLNVPYAAIHEFGGKTKAHVIEPLKAQILAWKGIGPALPARSRATGRLRKARGGGGFWIFARKVNHPGSNIPARPYVGPGVEHAASLFQERYPAAAEAAKQQLGFA